MAMLYWFDSFAAIKCDRMRQTEAKQKKMIQSMCVSRWDENGSEQFMRKPIS